MAKKVAAKSNRPNTSVATAPVVVVPAPGTTSVASRTTRPAASATREEIAKRAFEIWVAKGRPQGRDLENWQQAERELGVK